MCHACDEKAIELDQRLPHFLDRLHGIGEMPDSAYVPARTELWAFMRSKHGRVVPI